MPASADHHEVCILGRAGYDTVASQSGGYIEVYEHEEGAVPAKLDPERRQALLLDSKYGSDNDSESLTESVVESRQRGGRLRIACDLVTLCSLRSESESVMRSLHHSSV